MKKFFILILVCISIAGCQHKVVQLKEPFDEQAAQAKLAPGKNEIFGSALLRQRGGGVVTCAGNPVYLMPVTPTAIEWATLVFGTNTGGYRDINSRAINTNSALFRAVRTTHCNAQGFFSFPNVADGEYFVYTRVTWTVRYEAQGGLIMRNAWVKDGQKVEIVLSH